MNGHNDNDICRICIKSMKMIPQDVRSNLGGGEASRPHVISLTCHGVLTDYNNDDLLPALVATSHCPDQTSA